MFTSSYLIDFSVTLKTEYHVYRYITALGHYPDIDKAKVTYGKILQDYSSIRVQYMNMFTYQNDIIL